MRKELTIGQHLRLRYFFQMKSTKDKNIFQLSNQFIHSGRLILLNLFVFNTDCLIVTPVPFLNAHKLLLI